MDKQSSPISSSSERTAALDGMVLSASGWRAVFGGNDDSLERAISVAHRDLVALAVDAFLGSFRPAETTITIAVATDTRPTGPAIADTVIRVAACRGLGIRWIGIAAAPELMAYVAARPEIDGFVYVSASHNPPGHNGLKLGYADGTVMPAPKADPLISRFRSRAGDTQDLQNLVEAIAGLSPSVLEAVYQERDRFKREALHAYRDFFSTVGLAGYSAERFTAELTGRLTRSPLGIVAELNGSARSLSVDREVLPALGARLVVHNDSPGVFSHEILPEGAGLDQAKELLLFYGTRDPSFQIAYVPDNDGDRGNLVFRENERCEALDAQTVFALSVMIELAWARRVTLGKDTRCAVVANGPTSARVDEICRAYQATLFRAEVGEANVVSLAHSLAAKGWTVVIMGEGSNGGNITPPGQVRDPLSTLRAMLKLYAFRLDGAEGPWPGFLTVADSLPRYRTLATDDPRAKMHIGELSHRELKRRYEAVLQTRAPTMAEHLSQEYATSVEWRVINYEGIETREGIGRRSGEERGGLRVAFTDGDGGTVASVWMRGSGTEPVFRVLADCRGERGDLLDRLVEWQRSLVLAALED